MKVFNDLHFCEAQYVYMYIYEYCTAIAIEFFFDIIYYCENFLSESDLKKKLT